MEEDEQDLTDEEKERREAEQDKRDEEIARAYGYPLPEVKHNVHTFLNAVLTAQNTTKVGNLTNEELGSPNLPVRVSQELALFCDKMNKPFYQDYFTKEAEITLATSLSREGKLITLATTQKRIIADETKPKAENKGWFKRNSKPEEEKVWKEVYNGRRK